MKKTILIFLGLLFAATLFAQDPIPSGSVSNPRIFGDSILARTGIGVSPAVRKNAFVISPYIISGTSDTVWYVPDSSTINGMNFFKLDSASFSGDTIYLYSNNQQRYAFNVQGIYDANSAIYTDSNGVTTSSNKLLFDERTSVFSIGTPPVGGGQTHRFNIFSDDVDGKYGMIRMMSWSDESNATIHSHASGGTRLSPKPLDSLGYVLSWGFRPRGDLDSNSSAMALQFRMRQRARDTAMGTFITLENTPFNKAPGFRTPTQRWDADSSNIYPNLKLAKGLYVLPANVPVNDTTTYVITHNQATGLFSRRLYPTTVPTTVTGLTQAQLLFGSANGTIRQSSAIVFDSALNALGLNVTPVSNKGALQVTSATTGSGGYSSIFRDNNASNGSVFVYGWTAGGSNNKYKALFVDNNGINLGTLTDALNTSPVAQMSISNTGVMSVGANNNIKGAANTTDAAAGNIGEYISHRIASGSAVSLSTGTTSNIDSITLTAGDWDVTGIINYSLSGVTSTDFQAGFSLTSATMGNDTMKIEKPFSFTGLSSTYSDVLPTVRISVGSSTKIYLVAQGTFTVGTVAGYGQIRARRKR